MICKSFKLTKWLIVIGVLNCIHLTVCKCFKCFILGHKLSDQGSNVIEWIAYTQFQYNFFSLSESISQ